MFWMGYLAFPDLDLNGREYGKVLINITNGLHCIDSHLRKLLGFSAENFGAESGLEMILRDKGVRTNLSHIEQNLVINQITRDEKIFTDVTNALLHSHTVTTHD